MIPGAIEFDDDGPDKHDRRRFTLIWDQAGGVDNPTPQQIPRRRGQCFFSAQWRDFLAKGYREVKP